MFNRKKKTTSNKPKTSKNQSPLSIKPVKLNQNKKLTQEKNYNKKTHLRAVYHKKIQTLETLVRTLDSLNITKTKSMLFKQIDSLTLHSKPKHLLKESYQTTTQLSATPYQLVVH